MDVTSDPLTTYEEIFSFNAANMSLNLGHLIYLSKIIEVTSDGRIKFDNYIVDWDRKINDDRTFITIIRKS